MFKNKTYIILIAVLVLVYIIVQLVRPKQDDWRPSYSKRHSKPLGNEATFSVLEDLFPGKKLSVSRVSPFELFNDSNAAFNYILVDQKVKFSEEDTDRFLAFIAEGNHAFIAAGAFGALGTALSIMTAEQFSFNAPLSDSIRVNFTNPALKTAEGYEVFNFPGDYVFTFIFAPNAAVLGRNEDGKINFIRVPYGKGEIYLHSCPNIFTNVGLLKQQNHTYLSGAFSYLPVENTVWDEYYHSGRGQKNTDIRLLLDHETLRWAWFSLLGFTILFLLFHSKRRQKMVPVIKPPQNTTMEFVQTVGRLYYQQKNHTNLAQKQAFLFLDTIREKFHLSTVQLDAEFRKNLSLRSGVPQDEVDRLIGLIDSIRLRSQMTEQEILSLNNQIELFNKKSKR